MLICRSAPEPPDPLSTVAPAPFIVGVERSGTTLLRLMLDAHPALAILAHRIRSRDYLQRLQLRDLTGGDVAMPLRVPSGWSFDEGLSRVPEPAAYGPVFCLRCNGEAA